MSRIPRVQEHLKTGFTSEAAAAAKFRAYAHRARKDGLPHLAEHWLRLAESKDELARLQLEAAGKVRGHELDIRAEIAEERYENDVLYPKLIAQSGPDDVVEVFQSVIEAQRADLRRLEELWRALESSEGDVPAPSEMGDPVAVG